MNRLFASLYLDEDVDVLVARLVTSHGFDAVTSRDAGQLGRSDEEQLAYAAAHERAFVTHNRTHFEALVEQYFGASQDHFGIIIAVRRMPHEIVRRLLVILNDMTADEMMNQLIYIFFSAGCIRIFSEFWQGRKSGIIAGGWDSQEAEEFAMQR